jgi:hypothetical protein
VLWLSGCPSGTPRATVERTLPWQKCNLRATYSAYLKHEDHKCRHHIILPPPEPWRSFLRALDSQLKGAVTLRCLGGFVVTQQYGIGRSTGDIDFLSISTMSAEGDVERVGGLGSSLYKKYRVYVQYVGIATPPCDYADRLREMYPNSPWNNPIKRGVHTVSSSEAAGRGPRGAAPRAAARPPAEPRAAASLEAASRREVISPYLQAVD